MDLSFKQKVIIFAVMLGIFMCSVFVKQWIDGRSEPVPANNQEVNVEAHKETGMSTEEESDNVDEEVSSEEDLIVIDVEGAIKYPGIVKIKKGSRVYEAVDEAGGLLDTADTKYVNLAQEVNDGSIVYIPFEGENENDEQNESSDGGSSSSSLININTADKEKLMELPGIGESYAESIIEYRENVGKFNKIEDIMDVSGIGETKFEKMKDLICVW